MRIITGPHSRRSPMQKDTLQCNSPSSQTRSFHIGNRVGENMDERRGRSRELPGENLWEKEETGGDLETIFCVCVSPNGQ